MWGTAEGKRIYNRSQKTASLWIEEFETMLRNEPDRIKYYQEFVDFLINWMTRTETTSENELVKLMTQTKEDKEDLSEASHG